MENLLLKVCDGTNEQLQSLESLDSGIVSLLVLSTNRVKLKMNFQYQSSTRFAFFVVQLPKFETFLNTV